MAGLEGLDSHGVLQTPKGKVYLVNFRNGDRGIVSKKGFTYLMDVMILLEGQYERYDQRKIPKDSDLFNDIQNAERERRVNFQDDN